MQSKIWLAVRLGVRRGAFWGSVLFVGVWLIFSFGQPLAVVLSGLVAAVMNGLLHGALWGVIFNVAAAVDQSSSSGVAHKQRQWIKTGVWLGFWMGLVLGVGIGVLAGDRQKFFLHLGLAILGGVSTGAVWGMAVRWFYRPRA